MEAIDSVHAQTWRDTEVIVVDCGANIPDDTVAATWLKMPGSKLLRLSGATPQASRDAGIRGASGKYACCINGHEKLMPTYLEKCIFRLETERLDICDRSEISPGHFSPIESSIAKRLTPAAVFRRACWKPSAGSGEASLRGNEDWQMWRHMGKAGAIASTISEMGATPQS